MEDVVLKVPSTDLQMVLQMANRMGWIVENQPAPFTWNQANERLTTAKAQFASGDYKSHEQVMQHRSMALANKLA